MTVWDAVLLGFIQGATEFLPISSSGHLTMAEAVLALNTPGVIFEVAVHVATLLSIVLVYRGRLVQLARGAFEGDRDAYRYLGLLFVATLPAGLLGVFGKDAIEALFDNPYVTGVALLVTGTFLWSGKAALPRASAIRPGWGAALVIGVAQAFALVPGISRSGATVVTALWLGLEAREAAAFSFLMALPAIAGAAVLQAPEMARGAALSPLVLLGCGLVAGVTGVLAIRTFVAVLGRRAFHLFAPYCWVVGVAFLLYLRLR